MSRKIHGNKKAAIRRAIENGESIGLIAKRFNVSSPYLYRMRKNAKAKSPTASEWSAVVVGQRDEKLLAENALLRGLVFEFVPQEKLLEKLLGRASHPE